MMEACPPAPSATSSSRFSNLKAPDGLEMVMSSGLTEENQGLGLVWNLPGFRSSWLTMKLVLPGSCLFRFLESRWETGFG